jgi:hypothetical protein
MKQLDYQQTIKDIKDHQNKRLKSVLKLKWRDLMIKFATRFSKEGKPLYNYAMGLIEVYDEKACE